MALEDIDDIIEIDLQDSSERLFCVVDHVRGGYDILLFSELPVWQNIRSDDAKKLS